MVPVLFRPFQILLRHCPKEYIIQHIIPFTCSLFSKYYKHKPTGIEFIQSRLYPLFALSNLDVVNVLKQAVPTLVALDKVLTERNTKTYKSQGDIIATSLITDIVDSVVKLAEDPSASSEKIEELVKVVQTDVSVIETIYGVDFDLANLISIAGKLK